MLLRIACVCAFALSFGSVLAAEAPSAALGCGLQSKIPLEQRIKNTPQWTTASEAENFGYDVFRGESEQGPFIKLTKTPILGAGTTDETHRYQFADDSIDPCRDYWYYVESISTQGEREKFTPVFKAPAKRQPQPTKESKAH